MNHIYRLFWNSSLGQWVPVPEIGARNHQGGSSARRLRRAIAAGALAVGMVGLCAGGPALAAPVGGQVTAGTGTISQSGATTTITQNSQNLSINWQGFNTQANESVNFQQPNAAAVAVNRILDSNGTQFLGHLNANGQVYLINPNGILFGKSAQVNVGGLVASTLDVDDASLSSPTRSFSGTGSGSVVNQGTINTVQGGYVAFIGNTVGNEGTINAPQGNVGLAAGDSVTLTFADNSLVHLQVDRSTLNNLAENGGLIKADGGMILLTAGARNSLLASAVNNSGVIEARSVQNVNGSIVLDGGNIGTTTNSGTLDASGKNAGETGGTVKVLGGTVNLATGGGIDVSGDAGGGTALVGGNFHGAGPEQNAQTTTMDQGAAIHADAITNGNGGNVALWSDVHTSVDGAISARGGANGGNGGQIETSGHKLTVGNDTRVSTLAPQGTAGNWLLDPYDFTIAPSGGDITGSALDTALNSGNVTIQTTASSTPTCAGTTCGTGTSGNGDILVQDFIGGVNWTTGSTLTLSAYRDINISTNNGSIDLGSAPSAVLNLRADNTGNGTGTIKWDSVNWPQAVDGVTGNTINLYYNPSSYSSPTNYLYNASTNPSGLVWNADGGLTYHFYMLVDVNNASPAVTKTYDGTTTISSAPSFSFTNNGYGATPTAAAGLSTGTAAFNSANATASAAITYSGYSATGSVTSGGVTSSYYLAAQPTATGTISTAPLTVTASNASKTYGQTPTLTAFTSSGLQNGETIGSVTETSAGTSAGASVAGGPYTITPSAATGGTFTASNYNITYNTGNLTVNAAPLTVTGESAASKTYDGTTTATLSGGSLSGVLAADAANVVLTHAGTFATKNVGSNISVTAADGLTGTASGNYSLTQPTGLTANITAKALTVTGEGASSKVYDGTTTATLSGGSLSGVLAADSANVALTEAGSFASKNVGTGISVTASDSLSGTASGNYSLTQPTGLTANITAKSVVLTAPSVSKTYDGGLTYTTTAGDLTSLAAGLVGGDTVSAATIAYTNKNVGAGNKTVTLNAATISDGNGGANYNVTLAGNSTSTITAKAVTLTAPNVSKVYDAGLTYTTTAGDLTSLAAGLVGGDTVSAATIAYTNKNVGAGNKTVTLNAATISDGNGGANYNVTLAGNSTSTITAAPLTLSGITASNKTYDGTTAATLNTGGVTFSGLLGADVVTLGGTGVGTFSDKNAATGKVVTVSGYTLGGADAGNYAVAQPTGLTANITPAALTATITAPNKVYDGTTAAAPSFTITGGLVGTETVTASGTASFADKNVGTGKTVTANSVALANGANGGLAGNYTLAAGQTTTANITPVSLTISGITADNKVYDGTTSATVNTTGAVYTGLIAGDTVTVDTKGTFSDKNVGNGKMVSLSSTYTGADVGNYSITNQTSATANITPASLTLSGITADNKVYDGTTAATLNTGGVTFSGLLGADVVTLGGTGVGTFSDKNVGTGKTVTVSGYILGGTDAGNYTLAQPSGLTANITPATLTLTGITASNKTYDGSTSATLNTGSVGYSGLVAGDSVSLSGTGVGSFSDKNVGTGKTVTVSGYTLSSTDAGNYTLAQPSGLTANITPATLMATASPTTIPTGPIPTLSGTVSGFIPGDTLANSTTGTLQWVTDATDQSMPGQYAINGMGLSAQNYVIDQAASNASALHITAPTANTNAGGIVLASLVSSLMGTNQPIATPNGLSTDDGTGNPRRAHAPVVSTDHLSDYSSQLALRIVGGGVRLPEEDNQ